MTKWRGLRHPKTAQEKRQNQNCEYCRPARRPHNLIDAWDEEWAGSDTRCWKRYRKTQYKVKTDKPQKDSFKYSESMKKRNHWHLENKCEYCPYKDICNDFCIIKKIKKNDKLQRLMKDFNLF